MKYIYMLLLGLSCSAYSFKAPEGCQAISESGKIPKGQEWQPTNKCISKPQALETLNEYINLCGIGSYEKGTPYSDEESEEDKLANILEYDELYGRSFLKKGVTAYDSMLVLIDLFNNHSLYRESGKIRYYLHYATMHTEEGFVGVSCSGRVYEYLED